MIIDTHSHLNFHAFENDKDEIIKKNLDSGIWMINVGTKYETSKSAIDVAQNYKEGVYAVIGLHPIYAGAEFVKLKTDTDEGEFLIREEIFDEKKYLKIARSEKVVAIGEIGLDYYYRPKAKSKLLEFKEKQKEVFVAQLNFAKKLNLPVILHCRMAHDDLLKIIISQKSENLRGVIHCFTGNLQEAKRYIELGFMIGINGIIFKMDLSGAIKNIGLENILLETDCPYLTPPQAPSDRNEPAFLKYVISEISKLKNVPEKEVEDTTSQNARELFQI